MYFPLQWRHISVSNHRQLDRVFNNKKQPSKLCSTGPLWAESTGHWWIPLTKGQRCVIVRIICFVVAILVPGRNESTNPSPIVVICLFTLWMGKNYINMFFACSNGSGHNRKSSSPVCSEVIKFIYQLLWCFYYKVVKHVKFPQTHGQSSHSVWSLEWNITFILVNVNNQIKTIS